MRLSSLVHARRRSAVADEGGFALIAVLAVIAFTGITIAALLGMMMTTLRVTGAQEEAARARRAADGAIENAIEKMRDVPCDPAAQPFLAGQQIGGVTVDVGCTSASSGSSTTDQVRLVGVEGYAGAYADWTVDCAANAAGAGCLPWSSAGMSPSGTAGDISLVHSGPEALRFDSGVTVRRGAVALRNPTTGTPAIQTGGEYNQGRPGLGRTGTDCGLLSGTPGAGAGRVTDSSGFPSCGVPAAANLQADTAANLAGLVPPTAPISVPTNCAGAVVTFQPGTYDAAQTSAVSSLTSATTAGCQNKTFWFSPGIYSFQGSELVFASTGSYYVFGAPQGWNPATGVQASPALVNDASSVLCGPDVSGTSILTAGWTQLTHRAGRVAICPARPSSDPASAHPAIFQQTSVPNGVTVTSRPATEDLTLNFHCSGSGDIYAGLCLPVRTYNLNLATQGAGRVNSLRVMLTGSESRDTPNNFITRRDTRFQVFGSNNAVICETDWVSGTPNGGLTSSFDLKTMPGLGSRPCSTTTLNQEVLNGARITVLHRMLLTVWTVNQPLTLTDAAVEVNAHVGRATGNVTGSGWNNPNAVLAEGGAAATPQMQCADGTTTHLICQVADPGRTITPARPFVHEFELRDFDFPTLLNSATQDPAITQLRAVVSVRPSAATLPASWTSVFGSYISATSFLPESVAYVELSSPTGGRCVTQGTGMNSDQELSFDLLDPNIETSTSCNTFLFDNASDLDQLTMRVRFEMPCIRDWLHGVPWECLRSNWLYNPADASPIWQVRPPDVDSVRLTAVTDTHTSTSTSTVTSNAVGGAASTSFNVYGMTWMPLTDLDIAWRGPATTTPLFSNDLVVNGLGSRMFAGAAMGTVCCTPPNSRTAELTASIDGVDRMVARVQFNDAVRDPTTNRAEVNVLRWLNCGGACAAVLAESDTNANLPP